LRVTVGEGGSESSSNSTWKVGKYVGERERERGGGEREREREREMSRSSRRSFVPEHD
jgi:hypothetical protein